jgi:hypothetical protein
MSIINLLIPSKKTKQSLTLAGTLALSAIKPQTTLADWTANLRARTFDNDIEYIDNNQFGTRTNATSNFDNNIDKRDPPPTFTGINIFQESDDFQALAGNYVGNNDIELFRGVIEYNSINPTQTLVDITSLPNGNFTLLAFSDSLYQDRNNAFNLENNNILDIGTNTLSYIISKTPSFTKSFITTNTSKLSLEAFFHSDDKVPNLDIYSSSKLPPTNTLENLFTNYQGNLNLTSNGIYSGEINFNNTIKFFRLQIP